MKLDDIGEARIGSLAGIVEESEGLGGKPVMRRRGKRLRRFPVAALHRVEGSGVDLPIPFAQRRCLGLASSSPELCCQGQHRQDRQGQCPEETHRFPMPAKFTILPASVTRTMNFPTVAAVNAMAYRRASAGSAAREK